MLVPQSQSPPSYSTLQVRRQLPLRTQIVGSAVFQSMAPPTAGSDRDATSVASGMSSSPSTADGRRKSNPCVRHCIGFRNGTCTNTDRTFPQLSKAQLAEERNTLKGANAADAIAAVATSKAKAKPKAKAKAPCISHACYRMGIN